MELHRTDPTLYPFFPSGQTRWKSATTMPEYCMVKDVDDPFEIESDLSVMPDAAADAVVPGTRNAVSSRRVIRVLRAVAPAADTVLDADVVPVVLHPLTQAVETVPPTTGGISHGAPARWAVSYT